MFESAPGSSSGDRRVAWVAWALAAVFAVASLASPADAAKAPGVLLGGGGEIHRPVDTLSGGVMTGLVFDGVGLACVLIAVGFANDDDLKSARLNCLAVASMSLTLGGIVGTTAYSSRHTAVQRAGFAPQGSFRTTAWVLTALTAASFATSAALAVASEDEEDVPSAIDLSGGAVAGAIAAVVFEAANLAVRELWWRQSLESAPRHIGEAATITPVVGVARSTRTANLVPTFGFFVMF